MSHMQEEQLMHYGNIETQPQDCLVMTSTLKRDFGSQR